MRLDFGLVLSIFLQCIFFIYYADTLFYRKKNKVFCYSAAALGYALHGFICMFGNMLINIALFFIINFIVLIICYHIKLGKALMQTIILTVMSSASELIFVFLVYIGIDITDLASITSTQSLVITIFGNVVYLIGIMLLTHIFKNKKDTENMSGAGLMIIPALTLVILLSMLRISNYTNSVSAICLVIIIIDLTVFIVNQKLIVQNIENTNLKAMAEKDRSSLEEYTILKGKYEQMRVFHHDFKEHMNALSSLIDNDNVKAKEYIKSVYNEENSAQFIEYSDNKMLNVVLSQKESQCQKNEIQFIIEPVSASLAFINDTDTVSIFSNLLNNAIESCASSAEKKIYLSIYTENDNFIVIRIENSSDKEPLVIDGHLKTHKDNDNLHGIGMNSIRKALTNYNTVLKWKYDAKEKYFITTIIFDVSFDDDRSGDISTTQ